MNFWGRELLSKVPRKAKNAYWPEQINKILCIWTKASEQTQISRGDHRMNGAPGSVVGKHFE